MKTMMKALVIALAAIGLITVLLAIHFAHIYMHVTSAQVQQQIAASHNAVSSVETPAQHCTTMLIKAGLEAHCYMKNDTLIADISISVNSG